MSHFYRLQWGLTLYLLFAFPGHSVAFTFEDVQTLITNKKLKSIPEVLAELPPEFRSSYNLIRASLSLQQTSPGYPRVLLHTNDSKFIMAFNGDANQKGYDSIEMIQYRDTAQEFEFRELKFENGESQFSQANPQKCLDCHGQNPNPFLGGSGNDWFESFATTNDQIKDPTSKKEFAAFLKLQPNHDRYKYLIRKNTSKVFPFSNDSNDFNKFGDVALRPNFRMSIFLSRLNAYRISKYVLRSDFYQKYTYTTMHWLNCFSMGKELLDLENTLLLPFFKSQYPANLYPEFYREILEVGNGGAIGIGLNLYLMEKLLSGPDIRTWSLHRLKRNHGREWTWFDGARDQGEWIRQNVFNEFVKTHSEFAPYSVPVSMAEMFGQETYTKVFRVQELLTAYDGLGPIYSREVAESACSKLKTLSLEEIETNLVTH